MTLQERFPAYGGRGPGDLRLGLGLGVTATVLIFLRVYVRVRINRLGTRALIWALLAWALTVTTQVFGIISVLYGLGNHLHVIIEHDQMSDFLFYTWVTVFFFNLAIPTGKVAVAAFLIDMNAQTNPQIRRVLTGTAIFNIVVNIPQALMVWFQCHPVDALWDPLRQDYCNHSYNVNYTYFVGAVAAVSDLILAIVPSYMLWPLKIDRKVKCGLSILLGTGVVAAAAAVVRSWAARFILEKDSSYGIGILFRWGEVEEWLVIICMSIPPVWPLFRPYCERFLNSASQNSFRFKPSRHSGISVNKNVPPSPYADSSRLEQRFGSHRKSTQSQTVLTNGPQIFFFESRENSESESTKGFNDWNKETEEWMELNEIGSRLDSPGEKERKGSRVEGFTPGLEIGSRMIGKAV